MIDTKPNLSDNKFEQCSGDILHLSGSTNVFGQFEIQSGATLSILPNAGLAKVLTSNSGGTATWQVIPIITPLITGATNGLGVTNRNICLGGNLVANTNVNIANKNLQLCSGTYVNRTISLNQTGDELKLCWADSGDTCCGSASITPSQIVLESKYPGGGCSAGLSVTHNDNRVCLSSTGATKTYHDNRGFHYVCDYSQGADNRWLPDKAYVDSLISGDTLFSSERITKLICQTSHGFSIGNVLGWSGGTYNRAIANGLYDGEFIGIVSKCHNANCFDLTQAGYVSGLTSLTANTTYFLSPTVAGLFVSNEPTTNNYVSKAVLIANTTTSGWVLPYPGYAITTGTTVGIVNACNGLSTDGVSVCLGGTLTQNTFINGAYQFLMGNSISPTIIGFTADNSILSAINAGPSINICGVNDDIVLNTNSGTSIRVCGITNCVTISCNVVLLTAPNPGTCSDSILVRNAGTGEINVVPYLSGITLCAANGLSTSGANIVLGGLLTGNTCIGINGKILLITGGTEFGLDVRTNEVSLGGYNTTGQNYIVTDLTYSEMSQWDGTNSANLSVYACGGVSINGAKSCSNGCIMINDGTSKGITLCSHKSGCADTYLQVFTGTTIIGSGIPGFKGAQYASNTYRNNFVCDSLVDAAYVTGLTSTIVSTVTGATNLGSGNGTIYTTISNRKLQLKTLSGGTNVTLTCNGSYIGINTPTVSVPVTGATNLGSGNGTIYTATSNKNLQLKSLSGGTNVNLTCNGNYIAINVASDVDLIWTGNTANGVGTYVDSTHICSQPNMTFDGTQLKVTGNVCATTCVRSALISGTTTCGSTAVYGGIICGSTCVESPIIKGSTCVCSPITIGSTCVCGPVILGSTCICSPIVCGSTCLISPITIGSTCVCSPIILGSTYVCSPVITGSTKVCSPIVCATTCSSSPLHCGACMLATSYVCSPVITGSTKVCSPIVDGTTCVTSPITCGTSCVVSPKFIENGTCLASTYLPFTMATDQQDPTGFVNGDINVSYSYADRKITLTGTLDYYWNGVKKTLTSPWTSSAHTTTVGTWYLYSTDGTNIVWSNSVWAFTNLMVALVNYKSTSGTTFGVRETHGLMPWQAHQDFHKNIGTYLYSGGLATSWTANTATDSSNSPDFNSAVIADEDLQTTINAITKGAYTLMHVSGNTSIYTVGHTQPFSGLTNSFIRVNTPSTGAWVAGVNARYYNVYQFLVPTTSDVTSQKFRTIFLQPQATFTTLATAQAEDSRGLFLGSLASESNEFIPFARITYLTANVNNNYGKVTIPTGGITYVVGNRMGSTSVSGVVSPTNHANLSNLTWTNSGHVGTNSSFAAFDAVGDACNTLASTIAKYCAIIISGNSSATGFTVNHAMSRQFVNVQVAQAATPYATVYTTVERPNTNCVCVTFNTAPSSGTNYCIIITG